MSSMLCNSAVCADKNEKNCSNSSDAIKFCSGNYVNIMNDVNNCGECWNACLSGQKCICGECTCNNDSVCYDENPCTKDKCVDGRCVSALISCDDGNPCTADSCRDGECVHSSMICDGGKACNNGECVCPQDQKDCDGQCIDKAQCCGSCNSGYQCDDGACVDINECDSSRPCVHGTCSNTPGSYACSCDPGYAGTNCETDIDECASNPCGANAYCIDGENSYICRCNAGWTGENCDRNVCIPNPCLHGGSCTPNGESYKCTCTGGYRGENCEMNPCTGVECGDHGHCSLPDGTCACDKCWTGNRCQNPIMMCTP